MGINTIRELLKLMKEYGVQKIQAGFNGESYALELPEGQGLTVSDKNSEEEVLTIVTATRVGVAYRANEPGDIPLVIKGDMVQAGDVLCIIEAMKAYCEITATVGGLVTDILFNDGQMVEYGAPLFHIRH